MTEKKIRWEEILAQANNIISTCQSYLSNDTIIAVRHYLDHGEYEMAIEGLFIDIMQLPTIPDSLNLELCIELAKSVKLDRDVVWQEDFWLRFTEFCNNRLSD